MVHCRKGARHHLPLAPRHWLVALLLAALPLAGRALCTSDEVPQPALLLERFLSADCAACWTDPATPEPAPGALAIDWVVPGRQGDAAPLSAVALPEALERLWFLRRPEPERAAAFASEREGDALVLRLAQGQPVNDYIGASIELPRPGRESWRAWLLLVEALPAGTEGSPVARLLVRNVFRPDWDKVMGRPPGRLADTRPMQIHEGAGGQRLRLVAVVHDRRGRLRAITRTECR